MVRLREATIEKLYKLIKQLEEDPTPHGAHYAERVRTLLDLYFGTLPSTYRGESRAQKRNRS
jgi:hypothetical protein